MNNQNEILRLLREKVNLEMSASSHFDVLSQSIYDATKETLGVNTLKRLFGFKTRRVVPRRSTMDVIARYLGFSDLDVLVSRIGKSSDISAFSQIEMLEAKDLNPGERVEIKYEPGRRLLLEYEGNSMFQVVNAEGSANLLPGDRLSISQFVAGHRFFASNVMRGFQALGPYESAKFRGIESIEILEN